MNTFVQTGRRITYSNSSGSTLASGAVVVLGNSIGIVVADIANGESGEVEIEQVHVLAAETDAAWSVGDEIFWDTDAEELTKTANANTVSAGMCTKAKLEATATGEVKLLGNSKSVPRATDVTELTDNSGGVDPADDTIAAITNANNAGSADVLPTAAAIAQLAAKQAEIIAALQAAGLMDQ